MAFTNRNAQLAQLLAGPSGQSARSALSRPMSRGRFIYTLADIFGVDPDTLMTDLRLQSESEGLGGDIEKLLNDMRETLGVARQ